MFKTFFLILLITLTVYADKRLDRYVERGRYQKALRYIDRKYPPQERDLDIWLKAGSLNQRLEMPEKALGCYIAILRKDPQNFQALLSISGIYRKLHRGLNAYTMIKKAVELNPTDEALWEHAQVCLMTDRKEEARESLLKIHDINPEAKKALGVMYFEEHDHERALPLLRKYFNTKKDLEIAKKIAAYYIPDHVDSCIEQLEYISHNDKEDFKSKIFLARYHMDQSSFPEAMEYYSHISETHYEAPDYYNIGVFKKAEGKLNEASKFFETVLGMTQDTALMLQTHSELGSIYLDQNIYDDALRHLKAIEGQIDIADLDLRLARCYDAVKDYDNSGKYAKKFLVNSPDNISANLILATSLEKKNYITKAKEIRDRVVSLDPNNANIQFEMGEYYYQNKQFQQAIKFFQKSYLLDQDPKCMERIAMCAYSIGQYDKAKDASESTLLVNPNSMLARELLFRVYMRRKEYELAAGHLEYLVEKQPLKLEFYINLTLCYSQLKNQQKLIWADEKIIELDPDDEISRRRLAEYKFQNKNYEDAFNLYNDLINIKKVKETDYPNIIETALQLKQKEKAIEYLKQYSRLRPKDPQVYKRIAELYYDLEKPEESYENYTHALMYDRSITGIYRNYTKLAQSLNKKVRDIIEYGERAVLLKETDYGVYVILGNSYLSLEDYESALPHYHEALNLDSKDLRVLSNYALCQLETKRVEDAIISYEQLVMLNFQKEENHRILGDLYEKIDKVEAAIKHYKGFLETGVDDMTATKVAMHEYEKKNYQEALKYFSKMLQFSNKTLFALGESYIMVKDYERTIETFKDFLGRYPTNGKIYQSHFYMGMAYDSLKKVDEAIYHYNIYLQRNTDRETFHRVAQLQEQKDLQTAIRIYEKNIEMFPDDYRNFVRLGDLSKKTKEALRYYEKAVSINETLLDVWLKLGSHYTALEDIENKIRVYQKAIALDPHNYEANKYLGITLYGQNKVKESLLYLELARSQNINDPEVLYTLGRAYMQQGQQTEGLMTLQTAKKLAPKKPEIRYSLVRYLYKMSRYDEALSEAEDLLKLDSCDEYFNAYVKILFTLQKYKNVEMVVKDRRKQKPEDIELIMTLARAQAMDYRFGPAIESYKMISFIQLDYVPALIGRGEAYLGMRDTVQAKHYFERALEKEPKQALAELGMARVYKGSDKAKYLEHLRKAQMLDPENPEIKKEFALMNQPVQPR